MKHLGETLKGCLVSSIFLLALPVYGQQTYPPVVSPTYPASDSFLELPRAQADASYPVPNKPSSTLQSPVQLTAAQVSEQFNAPISAPYTAPISTPYAAPISTPYAAPISAPYTAPSSTPNTAPSSTQYTAPNSIPYTAPSSTPISTPYAAPSSTPSTAPSSTQYATPSATLADVLQTVFTSKAQDTPQPASPGIIPGAANCEQTASCGQTACACCDNPFDHHCGFFGDYLFLRAFDVDMAHGIQQNGVGGLGTAPAGDVGVDQPQFSSGFRVGADWACSTCSDLSVTYTWYDSSTSDLLLAAPGLGGTTASLVLFPNTISAASTFSSLFSTYEIDFQTVDVDYNVLMNRSEYGAWNLTIGARYAHLQQDFAQLGQFAGAVGSVNTSTSIGFDGVGLRTGLDGQWELGRSRVALYGKGMLSVLFGEFNSRYTQADLTAPMTIEANSHWIDSRALPILETEIGLQWTSCKDHWQLGAGYYTAYWFNTVDTAEFIQAVQNQSFTRVGQAMVFTGLTAHAAFRF
jgi:hypothetical protein